jgi:hypothetical protein
LKKRIEEGIRIRQAYWKAVTPPGPSAEALWAMVFLLLIVMCVGNFLFNMGVIK